MVRLFHVYYPVRALALLGGEATLVCTSFFLAAWVRLGADTYLALNYEYGTWKILFITLLAVLCSYYFDLYGPRLSQTNGETYFRLLAVLSALSFLLAGICYFIPTFPIGPNVFLLGLVFLTFVLIIWRYCYAWLIQQPFLQERVYVLGTGDKALRVVQALRTHKDWGMDVVGWAGGVNESAPSREDYSRILSELKKSQSVDRVLVALSDRRGAVPSRELLDIRLSGVVVE